MGYRSDVAIAIVFENLQKAREFSLKVMAAQPQPVRDALSELNVEIRGRQLIAHPCDTSCVVLHAYFENVKWYDEYEHVDAHKKLRELAAGAGAGWKFMRVGDDPEDVEECEHYPEADPTAPLGWWTYNEDDLIQVYRSINMCCAAEMVNGKPLKADALTEMQPAPTAPTGGNR